MKDLREYPRTRYRRAWIVMGPYGSAYQHNGQGSYVDVGGSPGELFFIRQDAEYVLRRQRQLYNSIAKHDPSFRGKAEEIHIRPIMVPRVVGPSEHVRAVRFAEAVAKKTGYYPGSRDSLERMLQEQQR